MPKKKSGSFNDTQIKDGWIVKVRKDGRIKSRVEPYINKTNGVKNGRTTV
jgi:hypothetical protein